MPRKKKISLRFNDIIPGLGDDLVTDYKNPNEKYGLDEHGCSPWPESTRKEILRKWRNETQ